MGATGAITVGEGLQLSDGTLTNTLDIKMPLTINSPEYVASLNAYDTDDDYNLVADRDSKDYG